MKKIKFNIYTKILFLEILVILLMSILVPALLNYPPNSELPNFQKQVEPISHSVQYLALGSLGIILYIIVIPLFFKNIFKFIDNPSAKYSKEDIDKIRKECFSIPKKIILFQLILLLLILVAFFSVMHLELTLCFKLALVYFSFFTVIAIISNILIKSDIDIILKYTYRITHDYKRYNNIF